MYSLIKTHICGALYTNLSVVVVKGILQSYRNGYIDSTSNKYFIETIFVKRSKTHKTKRKKPLFMSENLSCRPNTTVPARLK